MSTSPVTRPQMRDRGSAMKQLNGDNFDLKTLYQLKPRYLIDYHVEKPVHFAGEVDGVSPDLDMTNRTDVLRIIDTAKKQGVVAMRASPDQYASLSLSVFYIEVNKYNTTQGLLLRIPVHEVAAICYIKDDQQHLLVIKFGTQESCKIALLFCDTKPVAEEICALVNQCFMLVYNDSVDDSMYRLNHVERPGRQSDDSPLPPPPGVINPFSPLELPHDYDLMEETRSRTSVTEVGAGQELLDDYMRRLTQRLSPEELPLFLQYLNDWKSDGLFSKFCGQVLHLFGQERKHLLTGLLPFIPSDDYTHFEEFLRLNDINFLENASTVSSSRTNLRTYSTRRSLSEVSTSSSMSNHVSSGEALERLLDLTRAVYNSVEIEDPEVPEDYT